MNKQQVSGRQQLTSNAIRNEKMIRRFFVSGLMLITGMIVLHAQEKPGAGAQELADKLSNSVANMISVPIQNNLDYGIGPYNGSKYTINVQPVIPIHLSQHLNLITRYIIPIADQRDITGENTNQFGLSDATISAWFSPTSSKNGWIWRWSCLPASHWNE